MVNYAAAKVTNKQTLTWNEYPIKNINQVTRANTEDNKNIYYTINSFFQESSRLFVLAFCNPSDTLQTIKSNLWDFRNTYILAKETSTIVRPTKEADENASFISCIYDKTIIREIVMKN